MFVLFKGPRWLRHTLKIEVHRSDLATCYKDLTPWKRPWCCERLKAGGEGDNRGWDGWMASPTQWTWVWVNSGSWQWAGRLARCSPWGHKESDTTERLNWTDLYLRMCSINQSCSYLIRSHLKGDCHVEKLLDMGKEYWWTLIHHLPARYSMTLANSLDFTGSEWITQQNIRNDFSAYSSRCLGKIRKKKQQLQSWKF